MNCPHCTQAIPEEIVLKAAAGICGRRGKGQKLSREQARALQQRAVASRLPSMRRIARVYRTILEDPRQFRVIPVSCPPTLNLRVPVYASKADAMRAAVAQGYTHATGSGTYWPLKSVRRIPRRFWGL